MRQALYRKYRPRRFDQVYGQDNIVNILKNQIKTGNISHAYIFSGTRGTGKTTCAKIFSKAVNCLNPVDGNPCDQCENCKAIQEERTMDIIEMDAATNRGIDDIRQLRDKVIYPPTNLKYKVYIVDEAHMITREAFNALLKIMEEPPKHLIFILATTEIDKVPDTILSRTQRFDFKRIDKENIERQIRDILALEDVEMAGDAIDVISQMAYGGMRDALSILDQVISVGRKDIRAADVYDLLGMFSRETKISYARAIFSKDMKALFALLEDEAKKGKDSHNFIKELIGFFRDMLMDKAKEYYENYGDMLKNVSLERLVNSLNNLVEYEGLMKKSDNANLLFQLVSIRLLEFMPREDLELRLRVLEEKFEDLNNRLSDGTLVLNAALTEKEVISKKEVVSKVEESMPQEKIESENSLKDEATGVSGEEESDFEEALPDSKPLLSDDDFEAELQDADSGAFEMPEAKTHISNDDMGDYVRNYLVKQYPYTSMLFEGLIGEENRKNLIIYYLKKDSFVMAKGMNFFIRNAEVELSKEFGFDFQIKFEEGKEENIGGKEGKLEELRALFPKDKLTIKD
ncbi:DNA polymerase III subunit gamma/tau [Peptoniphilaceae bacterium SGI.131]